MSQIITRGLGRRTRPKAVPIVISFSIGEAAKVVEKTQLVPEVEVELPEEFAPRIIKIEEEP